MLIILFSLLAISLTSAPIIDEVWLKAVKLESESLNAYPSKTHYIAETKDKKGKVEEEERIVISHEAKDGKVINNFVEGFNSEGPLSADDESVKRYLSMDATPDDEGFFKSETSADYSVERIANETIDGQEYAKYKVAMKSDSDGIKIDSEGYVWLDSKSGLPFKKYLEVDPHKMVIKEFNVTSYHSLSETGIIQADKTITNIVISLVFKKIYVTQTIINENYLKLN